MKNILSSKIVPISQVDSNEWHNLLINVEESNFFSTFDYWQMYQDNAYVLQVRLDEILIAVIPFSFETILPIIGKYFKFCRLESSLLVDKKYNERISLNEKNEILNYLLDYLKSEHVIFITITSKARSRDALLLKNVGFTVYNSGTYILNLQGPEADIYKGFSKGHKSSIQKAIKSEVTINILEGNDAFEHVVDYLKIQNQFFERKKGNFPVMYLKTKDSLEKTLKTTYCRTFLAIAYYQDQPAAGALLTSFDKSIYYYLGVSDFALTRISQASNLLHWEIIKFAQKNGFVEYDFGGADLNPNPSSDMYGVFMFKKNFGGEPREFQSGNLVLKKSRYNFLMKLSHLQYHPILSRIVKLIRR